MIGTNRTSPESFPRSRGAIALGGLAIAASLTFAGCSGGGGGGGPGNAGPIIVAAAYTGGNASPQAGDTVLITFSEDIQLISGALLTDSDVALSAGSSLGDVTAAPALAGSRSVTITLGPGVALTLGGTTIALSSDNDVIRGADGQLGEVGPPVTIGNSDGQPPTLSNITIAKIDGELNGTGAAGGTLQVPPNGWTIDLTFADNSGIDPARTFIGASVAVGSPNGTQAAESNLTPLLTLSSSTATTASYTVPTTVTFPQAAFTLTCTVIDLSGLASTSMTFSATARNFADSLRPFETNVNAGQVWFLDFTRDVESFSAVSNMGNVAVLANAGSNGVSDFIDILRILGLNTETPVAQNPCTGDVNMKARDAFNNALIQQLGALLVGANVSFTLTQPSGSFGTSSSLPYSSFGYSQISVAGSATSPGVLGVAIFDPSNTTQDDNTQLDFGGLRLGVFLHTIAHSGLGSVSASPFRMTFDALAPIRGGTPIGGDGSDCARLDGTVVDLRTTAIDNAIQDFARFTAVIIAHECGHSMGLVENGPMPIGLFGNDPVNFPNSSDGHIRNDSLFPAGATNVMSPSLTYSSTVNAASAFNTLNLAYLREQVFYGN